MGVKNIHWQALDDFLCGIFKELDDAVSDVEGELSFELLETLECEVEAVKARLSMAGEAINRDIGKIALKKDGPALFARLTSIPRWAEEMSM